MKRIILLTAASLLVVGASYAQGEMDAYKLSRNDLRGTARSMGMGGAFGALGGDVSAISINPAGIGVYRTSEIVTTLNFENTRTETNQNAGSLVENRFKFNFDNLGFVTVFPTHSDVAPSINFGFSYNRLKNFDRRISARGRNTPYTLTDYMAENTNRWGYTGQDITLSQNDNSVNNRLWRNEDWLSILGQNSSLITDDSGKEPFASTLNFTNNINDGLPLNNQLFWEERGSINTYDFNMGTTFADKLSWGVTLSVTDINYNLYSVYSEDFFSQQTSNTGGYDLINSLSTRGSGWQIGTGLIFRPIDELRLGVSYQSPTWYNMTDTYWADLDHNLSQLANSTVVDNTLLQERLPYTPGVVQSFGGDDAFTNYQLRTPDKWTFSAAGVIAKKAIISADFELKNYGRMRLFDNNGRNLSNDPNFVISKDFRTASTFRVGAEYRVTPQFSARLGYSWMQSPLQNRFLNNEFEVETVGSIPHYILDGDTNIFTYGLGYRFNRSFYADVAFVFQSMKSDLYMFPKIFDKQNNLILDSSDKRELKTNKFQGLLTMGYRF